MGEPTLAQKPPEGEVKITAEEYKELLQATPQKKEPGKIAKAKAWTGEKWTNFWEKHKAGKKAKAPGQLSGLVYSDNPETTSIITKLTKSLLSENAKPKEVAEIMAELSYMRQSVTAKEAQELGMLLLDIRVNKPKVWAELVTMKNAGDPKAKMVVNDINKKIIPETQKALGMSMAPDDFLKFYKTRPESLIEPDEVMKIVRILEGGSEKPLVKTAKLFGFDLAKMTGAEKAAMYIELLQTGGVTYNHIAQESGKAYVRMIEKLHNNHSPEFSLLVTELAKKRLKGSPKLDDLLFEALKSEETELAIRANHGDEAAEAYHKYINEFNSLDAFLKSKNVPELIPKEYSPKAMKQIKKLLQNDYAIYMGMSEGGSTVIDVMKKTSDDISAEYTKLIPKWVKKIGNKVWKGTGTFLKWGTYGMGSKAMSEFKKGTKPSKIKGLYWGAGQVALVGGYVGLFFLYKYVKVKWKGNITDKTVKEVKEITGIDMSKKLLKFYTSDVGISVLRTLSTEFPQNLEENELNYNMPEHKMLKALHLKKNKNGKLAKKAGKIEYMFNDLLLLESLDDFVDIMKADFKKNGKPKSEKELEKRVTNLINKKVKKDYIKKGYLIPKYFFLIREFCFKLEMAPKSEAVEYLESNPAEFFKFWKGVKDGNIPRATAALYADNLAGISEYGEESGLVLPSESIAPNSLMDIFDQYASIYDKYLPYFNKVLKLYNKNPKYMKNLNAFALGPGEVVYGSISKLAKDVATADSKEELAEIAAEARNINNGKGYWIGNGFLMSLTPKIGMNFELVQFVMEYSSPPGEGVESSGMLAWLKENQNRIKKPYSLVKYLYDNRNIFELKGKNYGKVYKTLDKKIKDFEKAGWMGAAAEKELFFPRAYLPKTPTYIEVTKEGKKAKITNKVIKDSQGLLEYLPLALDNFNDTKDYKLLTDPKTGIYTEQELLELVNTYFLSNISKARDGDKGSVILLKDAGIELQVKVTELGFPVFDENGQLIMEAVITDPDKIDKTIRNKILVKESKKLKKNK